MDILKCALKVSLEIKADLVGYYFRHIELDLKLGNLHYRLNKDFDPFPGRSRASACVSVRQRALLVPWNEERSERGYYRAPPKI